MATTTTRGPASRSKRAACAATAVLPTRLPVPTDGQGGPAQRPRLRRAQLEVGALVDEPGRQRVRGQPHPPLLAQHRLVGQVEHPVGAVPRGGVRIEPAASPVSRSSGTPKSGSPASFSVPPRSSAATTSQSADACCEGRAHHRRVVLAVDQGQHPRAHQWLPRSGGCFSYASVSVEKRMIVSRP